MITDNIFWFTVGNINNRIMFPMVSFCFSDPKFTYAIASMLNTSHGVYFSDNFVNGLIM